MRRQKGFTLLEILAASCILAITLGISLSQARRPEVQRGPQAEAQVVAEFLKAAQAHARASGAPAGVGFPTEQGSRTSSQSVYRLQGHLFPRVVAVKNLAGEFSASFLSVAHWDDGHGPLTVDQPETPRFLVAGWQPPFPKDHVLIFLPSGQVLSNGLASSAGNYHVVVSSGVELTPDSGLAGDPQVPDPPPSMLLQGASHAYTITVSQSGEISVSSGLIGRPDLDHEHSPPPVAARPPTLSLPASRSPELLKVEVSPLPADLPAGVDALIPLNGRASLEVQAWSPEGSDLTAYWEGKGQFSTAGASPMSWDPLRGVWSSHMDWTPPAGFSAGDEITLDVRVEDQFGHIGSGNAPHQIKVRLAPSRSKILCSVGSVAYQVYSDGTQAEALTRPSDGNFSSPRWAPDGSKFSARSSRGADILVAGAGPVKNLPGCQSLPRWSPDGTKLMFIQNAHLWVSNADGSDLHDVTPNISPLGVHGGYSWSPDSRRIAYCTLDNNNIWTGRCWRVDVSGANRKLICPSNSLFPSWSPDGSKIAFLGYGNPNGICTVDPDGNQLDYLLNLNGIGWLSYVYQTGQFGWSPDSKKLSFFLYLPNDGWLMRMMDCSSKVMTSVPNSANNGENMGCWAPDGSDDLLFLGTGNQLELIHSDGTSRRKLFKDPTTSYSFDWVK